VQDRAELKKICDAIRYARSANYCLQLLVEDSEGIRRVWRLNWWEAQLNYVETKPPISFEMLLQNITTPSLIERRRLALVLAYSLFQLHESPWLSQQWDKDHIHFFYTSTGVDLQRPYLTTSFDKFPSGCEPLSLDLFQRNLGILKLGILLIEIHKWKPIESFQTADDLRNGEPTPNTYLTVARRVLNTLRIDCYWSYISAIGACLDMPWAVSGSRVSLEDSWTWNCVYKDVIEPLVREVALADPVNGFHIQ